MRYTKPVVLNSVPAAVTVQGGKTGIPGDSSDMGTRTNGAAYEGDE